MTKFKNLDIHRNIACFRTNFRNILCNCWVVTVVLVAVLAGCHSSRSTPAIESAERLRLGVENPPLLPAEKSRSVTLRHKSRPTYITDDDMAIISSLVGRVPGLFKYEVLMIKDSGVYPGLLDVYTPSIVVRMKKDKEWHVFLLNYFAYDKWPHLRNRNRVKP